MALKNPPMYVFFLVLLFPSISSVCSHNLFCICTLSSLSHCVLILTLCNWRDNTSTFCAALSHVPTSPGNKQKGKLTYSHMFWYLPFSYTKHHWRSTPFFTLQQEKIYVSSEHLRTLNVAFIEKHEVASFLWTFKAFICGVGHKKMLPIDSKIFLLLLD